MEYKKYNRNGWFIEKYLQSSFFFQEFLTFFFIFLEFFFQDAVCLGDDFFFVVYRYDYG